jgi:hypothetical protein
MSFEFNNPLIMTLRSGSSEDPFININDTRKIINNTIYLNELPDSFNKVSISGYYETTNSSPSSNEFFVNYTNGIITFNPSESGKTVMANYKGRGLIQYPSSRIYTQVDNNNNPIETLKDIIEDGRQAIDVYGGIIQVISDAQEENIILSNTISTGDTLHTNLTNDISTGNTVNANLGSSIDTANTSNSILQTSIQEAETYFPDIDAGYFLEAYTEPEIDGGVF